jgi:rfaE bifunctional protein kinase chain/domain
MNVAFERLEQILSKLNLIPPILTVGDIGIDKYTAGEVSRISPEAPVPILEVQREWKKLGLAANVSDNLQALGVKSSLCGVAGDDFHGDLLLKMLDDWHISSLGVVKERGRMTTFKERVTTQNQQICRIDYETKAPIQPETEEKLLKKIEDMATMHSALILEDYAKGGLTEKIATACITTFKDAKKLVTVDPSRTTPPQWYKGASLLKPNWHEALQMAEHLGLNTKNATEITIASFLLEKLDLEHVVITLGAKGIFVLNKSEFSSGMFIPTQAREVYDVSGAGDTVISTLTASLVAQANLAEACWLANLAAAIVVGKKGTATTSPQEIKKFYKVFLMS